MTQLLANQQWSEIPTWLQDIVNYLKDFLSGKYDSKMVGQNSKMVVKVLRRFMMLGVKEGESGLVNMLHPLIWCVLNMLN